ncbi:MAG: metallophosphoesterase family protein [Bacteroidales bacterium]|nr:metallophosphoesterase family protein [Bacteroidales bacterium]
MKKSTIFLAGLTIFLLFTGFLLKKKLIPLPQESLPKIAPQSDIPKSYSNIYVDDTGNIYFQHPETGAKSYAADISEFRYSEFQINPTGTDAGMEFDFMAPGFEGLIYYGLINEKDVNFPQPVFFKKPAVISGGKANIPMAALRGKYDFTDWETSGEILLGYRIVFYDGTMIYDSRVRLTDLFPFKTAVTVIDGPYLNQVGPNSAIISFTTNFETRSSVEINNTTFKNRSKTTRHEIKIDGLKASTKYNYTVNADTYQRKLWFKTAPEKGSQEPFIFAFASDSRAGKGGGERNLYGANVYIIKKMAALTLANGADFMQYTGDLINGYATDRDYMLLQYQNHKRGIEPFAHRIPFIIGIGNHEALNLNFITGNQMLASIDKFPWDTESTESVFAEIVVNPLSSLKSEDGSKYDPDPKSVDFPSYDETVFYYTYGNMAMVVLNSDYWYAPAEDAIKFTSGNPHGYIMDNQLAWLKETILNLEEDKKINHIFVTIHTPAFPNGGHAKDDMWYNGNNEVRPYVAGQAVEKGIIQRRDEFLDILINQSKKTVALLCGDEHNYSRTRITKAMQMYPEDYPHQKLEISRTFWQLTNGAAGAPYYAQEQLPWTNNVEAFSTQYALIFFHIEGNKIKVEVLNPDTLEKIEDFDLK